MFCQIFLEYCYLCSNIENYLKTLIAIDLLKPNKLNVLYNTVLLDSHFEQPTQKQVGW